MKFFRKVDGGSVVLNHAGVYREASLYVRGNADMDRARIYASFGTGLVRLNAGGTTSKDRVRWTDVVSGDNVWSEDGAGVFVSLISE